MLFKRLIAFINDSPKEVFTKGEYYSFVKNMVKDVHIDPSLFSEVYRRIYALNQSSTGISKLSLLLFLSSLYPNNNSLISSIFERIQKNGVVSFDAFSFYLRHVYTFINEVGLYSA